MKKIYFLILFVLIFYHSYSQTTNYGVTQDGCLNKFVISVTSLDYDFVDVPNNMWGSGVVTVTWDKTYGQAIIGSLTNLTAMTWLKNTALGYIDYGSLWGYEFTLSPDVYNVDIASGATVAIFSVGLTGAGFATFTLTDPAPNNSLYHAILGETLVGFNPSSVSNVTLEPAVFWDGSSWCGGSGTSGAPNNSDSGKRCYIKGSGAVISADAQVKSLNVRPGADITVNSFFDVFIDITLEDNGSSFGYLTINPTGSVTSRSGGVTALSVAHQLKVLANSTRVGSFIDGGTVNHGTSGTADVQTYIKNSANSGYFYPHLVGPTVDDPVATGFSGVYLQAFDLSGDTYAYEYLEPSNTWSNISSLTAQIGTTKGILLSTVTPSDQTITMTGHLLTGTVTSAALQHGGTIDLDLLSNPYPSSLDFDQLYNANSSNISNKYYLFNPTGGDGGGNYVFYQIPNGGSLPKEIQVGQGFFVETLSSNAATFNNSMRVHSTAQFLKDTYAHQLRLNLEGNGFSDATFIYFKDEGVWGYDHLNDAYKWWSMITEASELWTVANDGSLLCMNSLPPLGTSLVSVPMGFKCGADTTFKIAAENIGSFDEGTQIYLEDILTGGEWHDLIANPVYEFSGTPLGEAHRFVVHFFGPTSIDDPDAASLIKIYGYGRDAYIVNRGTETVKEYVAYDMMGRELHRGTLPNNTVNKVTIGDASAYYIVKVITKEGRVYTDKVYITK